jgi:dihydroorotate dehydrogenase electron transfer subunit
VREFCAEAGVKAKKLTPRAMRALQGAQLARQRARAAQPDGAARDHDAGSFDRPGDLPESVRAGPGVGAEAPSLEEARRSFEREFLIARWPITAGTSRAPPRRSGSRARACRARSRATGSRSRRDEPRAPRRHAPIRGEGRVVSLADEGGVNRRLVLAVPRWPGHEPVSSRCCRRARAARRRAPTRCCRARWRCTAPAGEWRDPQIEILFKVHGRGTALLADLAPGDRVASSARSERLFPDPAAGQRAVIVAGGTGIASVYELASSLHARGCARFGAARRAQRARPDGRGRLRRERRAARDRDRGRLARHARARDRSPFRCARGRRARGDLRVRPDADDGCGRANRRAARRRMLGVAREPDGVRLRRVSRCAAPLRSGGFALVCRDGPVLPADAVAWESLP